MEEPEASVGQMWRDRDPRSWSGNRRVRVTQVLLGRVLYRQVVGPNDQLLGRQFSSKRDRFQRAFELIGAFELIEGSNA